jgi:P-type Ca2+ transporter type 2C
LGLLASRRTNLHLIAINPTFLAIAGAVAVGQILIVTFGGPVFQVEPLDIWTWLAISAFTSTVLIFAEIVRRFRVSGTA